MGVAFTGAALVVVIQIATRFGLAQALASACENKDVHSFESESGFGAGCRCSGRAHTPHSQS